MLKIIFNIPVYFYFELLRSISLIQTFKKQYKITKYKSKSETCELKYSKFSINNHNNTENDCSLNDFN